MTQTPRPVGIVNDNSAARVTHWITRDGQQSLCGRRGEVTIITEGEWAKFPTCRRCERKFPTA